MKLALVVLVAILAAASARTIGYPYTWTQPDPRADNDREEEELADRLFNNLDYHPPLQNADVRKFINQALPPVVRRTGPQTPYPLSPTGVPIVPPQYYPAFADIPIVYDPNSAKILRTIEAILMVVNSKETRATLALMRPISGRTKLVQTTTNGVTFTIGAFGMYRVAVVKTSPGTEGPNAATEKLERALAVVKPGFVISVGVCFGKNKAKLKFADILVANVINAYQYRRLGETSDVIRSPQPAVGARLLDIFDQTAGFNFLRAPDDPVQVKIDPLVSGPNLIDSVEVKNKLFESFPDAEGGEMEGAGILSAVRAIPGNRPEAIVIKAIVDWADGTKGKEWQPFAAHAAASYVLYHMKTNKFKELVPERAKVYA